MHWQEVVIPAAWFGFSLLMSTMPPVSDASPYFIRWMHDFGQALAANANKVGVRNPNPTQPVTTGQTKG